MLLHLCLAAVPACPAVPELKPRTYFITITRLHYILYRCLYYIARFLFLFVTLCFTKTIYILVLLRGIITKFGLAGWVSGFSCDIKVRLGFEMGWFADLLVRGGNGGVQSWLFTRF